MDKIVDKTMNIHFKSSYEKKGYSSILFKRKNEKKNGKKIVIQNIFENFLII